MIFSKIRQTNLFGYIQYFDTWIIRSHPNHIWISVQLSDVEFNRHFKILHDFAGFLMDNGYIVPKQSADFFATAFDDNLLIGYNYFFAICNNHKHLAEESVKWIIGPLKELMVEYGYSTLEYEYLPFKPKDLRVLIENIVANKVTSTMGKSILQLMFEGIHITTCLEMDQFKIADESDLDKWIDDIMRDNPEQVEKAKANPKLIQWFVGQVMKVSKGKANAAKVQEILKQNLVNMPRWNYTFDCQYKSQQIFRNEFRQFLIKNDIKYRVTLEGRIFHIFSKKNVNLILVVYDNYFKRNTLNKHWYHCTWSIE